MAVRSVGRPAHEMPDRDALIAADEAFLSRLCASRQRFEDVNLVNRTGHRDRAGGSQNGGEAARK